MKLKRVAPFTVVLLAVVSAPAFAAEPPSGKIEICRHPTITAQADHTKVNIQEPVLFQLPSKSSYQGDSDLWIEVDKPFTIGKKPSCMTTIGKVTRNVKNKPLPKKGSTWQAEASAVPGQFWGKGPDASGTLNPRTGGPIDSVTLRAKVLEDFK